MSSWNLPPNSPPRIYLSIPATPNILSTPRSPRTCTTTSYKGKIYSIWTRKTNSLIKLCWKNKDLISFLTTIRNRISPARLSTRTTFTRSIRDLSSTNRTNTRINHKLIAPSLILKGSGRSNSSTYSRSPLKATPASTSSSSRSKYNNKLLLLLYYLLLYRQEELKKKPVRILIVDDDSFILECLQNIIESSFI